MFCLAHPLTPSHVPCSLILVCVVLLAEAEELGSREIEIESKTFIIEVKSNDQGRFVKILEVQRERGRPAVSKLVQYKIL